MLTTLRRSLIPAVGPFHNILINGFCKLNESPDLPDWFKTFRSLGDSDDDFVLPTTMTVMTDGPAVAPCNLNLDPTDDVDKVSRFLKKSNFSSPDAVVQAMIGCSSCSIILVSNILVDRIVKRFSHDWVPAFGFFKWASIQIGYAHSSATYDAMVDVLGKSKQFDAMWDLVDEMDCNGGLVTLATMTKIMRRLAGAGRWMDAIETFHDIESFGVSKDTSAMNVLLDALCKERSVEHARDVFLELRSQVSPNAHSFNILIHGWCKARQLDEAHSTMEEMKDHGFHPCVISYTSLVEAYCADKNFRKVSALLDEMQDRGCPPNVVTYTIVMHSLGKAKLTQEAFQVLEKMKKNGCRPDTSFFNSLIYILCKAGRLQDARDIFEGMSKSGISPDVMTYHTMIASACEHSDEEDALKLLQSMKESSCKPDLKTYAPLLKICCKRKRMKILCYLLNDMFEKDVSLDLGTYSLLVHGLCRNGKLEQSCLLFKEMVFKGLRPKRHTYNMLIEEIERKNMEKAKERIQQLMVRAESMN
ncbi:pentatricopeptide repeat-containing protein At3g22670, mitochondrial [Magnolia sinica]|uniref:pentatricopeptide repeat-containing protein At3g22670, mitochondrial n=1 Tax=Magnolia sinica TaxID=86752 RepID=UPI0026593F3E|nr:pentatricopeptide repeat-containing protein At3g22670, mitochondrial [Magnolia sinica]XP_058105236.1 pentatricopeptide repeat-containing protein At3g22670, mitochondrial [Magnolia sinica]